MHAETEDRVVDPKSCAIILVLDVWLYLPMLANQTLLYTGLGNYPEARREISVWCLAEKKLELPMEYMQYDAQQIG